MDLQSRMVSHNCLVCVKSAQEEFFNEVRKSDSWPINQNTVRSSLSKWAVLWKYILQHYTSICKVPIPEGVKRPALAPISDNLWKMDEMDSKIQCINYLPVVNTYIKNISSLTLPNWSPTVEINNVAVEINNVGKTPKKQGLQRVRTPERKRFCKIKVAPNVLSRTPNILRAVPYIKLEDCLVPPREDPVVGKDSFMSYFNLTSMHDAQTRQSEASVKVPNSRTLRYTSIPFSSNLGKRLINSNSDTGVLVRIERMERYVNSASCSTQSADYPITFSKGTGCEHVYKFPKRQQHQKRLSLKRYACMARCRPVKVLLKRLNIDGHLRSGQFQKHSKGNK